MRRLKFLVPLLIVGSFALLSYRAGMSSGQGEGELEVGQISAADNMVEAISRVVRRRGLLEREGVDKDKVGGGLRTAVVRGRVLMSDGVTAANGAVVRLQGYSTGINETVQSALDAHGTTVGGESENVRTALIQRTTRIGKDGFFQWEEVACGDYGIHVELKRRGLTSLALLSMQIVENAGGVEFSTYDLGDILLGSIATLDGEGVRLDLPTDVVAGMVVLVDETASGVGSEVYERTLAGSEVLVLSPTGMRARIGCRPDESGSWRIEGLSPRGEGVFQVWGEMGGSDSPRARARALRAFHESRRERLAVAAHDEEREAIHRERPPLAGSARPVHHPYRGRWVNGSHCVVPTEEQPSPFSVELLFALREPAVYYGTIEVDVQNQGGFSTGTPHGLLVTMEDGTPLPVSLPLLRDGRASFSLVGLGSIDEAPVPSWLEVYGLDRHVRFRLNPLRDQVSMDGDSGLRVVAMQCLPEIVGESFQWRQGRNISGRLVDSHGEPLVGVLLGLSRSGSAAGESSEGLPPLSRTAMTDEGGVFRFHQVRPSETLGISAPVGLPPGLFLQDQAGRRCDWIQVEVPFVDGEVLLAHPICLGGRRLEEGR